MEAIRAHLATAPVRYAMEPFPDECSRNLIAIEQWTKGIIAREIKRRESAISRSVRTIQCTPLVCILDYFRAG